MNEQLISFLARYSCFFYDVFISRKQTNVKRIKTAEGNKKSTDVGLDKSV